MSQILVYSAPTFPWNFDVQAILFPRDDIIYADSTSRREVSSTLFLI